MTRFKKLLVGAVLVIGVYGFAGMQRPDLASNLTGLVALSPTFYANTATTGTWNNIEPFNAVAIAVTIGTIQNTDSIWLVFQDSTDGAAVATFDSVPVGAGLDSTFVDYNYQRTAQALRVLLRASGGVGDSNVVGAVILGMSRSR
jgi:hypothetical protein